MKDISLFLPITSAVVGAVLAFLFNLFLSRSGGVKIKQRKAFLARKRDSYDLIINRGFKKEYAIDYYHHSLKYDVISLELLVFNTASVPKIVMDLNFINNNCHCPIYSVETYEEGSVVEKEVDEKLENSMIDYISLQPGEVKVIKAISLFENEENEFNRSRTYINYLNPRTNFLKMSRNKKVRVQMDGYFRYEGEYDEEPMD